MAEPTTTTIQQGSLTIELRAITIRLGDREFEVTEAPILRARRWRKQFTETILPLVEEVAQARDIAFETPEDLLQLRPLVSKILVDALDQVVDLLLLYSEALEAEQEWILANASERQAVAAFWEVLKLAVPFELDQIPGVMRGLRPMLTSLNSPSEDGDSATETPSD